ncbi:helix-turn-helix domain-containing protein [Lactiplantibacillus plantarum]
MGLNLNRNVIKICDALGIKPEDILKVEDPLLMIPIKR